MGTGNFYYKNASKVFAINMNGERPVVDEDGNETDEMETSYPEQWECEDTRDNIQEQMKSNTKYRYQSVDGYNHDAPRSFPSVFIGSWSTDKDYAGVNIQCSITAMSNSGYYEGACLDWEVHCYVASNERDEVDAEDLEYYGTAKPGISKRIAQYANKWLDVVKEQMILDLEQLFEQNCEITLKRIATASNGETFYQKVEA
jgi:hypothetical protein